MKVTELNYEILSPKQLRRLMKAADDLGLEYRVTTDGFPRKGIAGDYIEHGWQFTLCVQDNEGEED